MLPIFHLNHSHHGFHIHSFTTCQKDSLNLGNLRSHFLRSTCPFVVTRKKEKEKGSKEERKIDSWTYSWEFDVLVILVSSCGCNYIILICFFLILCRFSAQEDEDDAHPNLMRRTTIGNGLNWYLSVIEFWIDWWYLFLKFTVLMTAGPPETILDWTRDSDLTNQSNNNQAFSKKHWRLLQCQNGEPLSCRRALFVMLEMEFWKIIIYPIW